MNQRNRIHNLRPQQFCEISISLDFFIYAAYATLGTILRVKCFLGVVILQCLSQVGLRRRIPVAWLSEALLRPSNELAQPALEFLEVEKIAKAKAIPDGL